MNTNRKNNTSQNRKSKKENKKFSRVPFWKDADGSVFIKENGKLVPFTGNIEELLGVQES